VLSWSSPCLALESSSRCLALSNCGTISFLFQAVVDQKKEKKFMPQFLQDPEKKTNAIQTKEEMRSQAPPPVATKAPASQEED
jgi:hypothetical protein